MWTVRLSGVPEAINYRTVSINGKVYSFDIDRAVSTSTLRQPVDVFIFDPVSYRWDMEQTQLPDGGSINVCSHTVVGYGHCAYLLGALHNRPVQSVLHRFDTTTMTWSRPDVFGEAPTSLHGTTACVVGHRIYMFGALDNSQDIRFVDLHTMEWHRVPTNEESPFRGDFYTASAIGTRIYVWGGILADPALDDRIVCDNVLYYLETTTSTWVRPHVQGVPPVGRQEHSAFVYHEDLYIFGGHDPLLDTYFADMHKYNTKTSRWTEVKPCGSGPSARCFHGCCTTGERVFIFGGFGPVPDKEEGEMLTDLHVLHLAPTLENLCLLALVDARLDIRNLPHVFSKEVNAITSHLSQPKG